MVMAMFHLAMAQKGRIEWDAWSHSQAKGLHSLLLPTVCRSFPLSSALKRIESSTRTSGSLPKVPLIEIFSTKSSVM